MFALENAQKLHTALHNTLRGVAIARHDAVAERTVVDADANSSMVLLTDIDKRHQLVLYLLQFLGIFGIGVLQMLERAPGIDIVARIDAYLFAILRCHISGMRRKVHISHQWCLVTVSLQTSRDILHVLSFTRALSGETHQFATRINYTLCLLDTTIGIVGVDGCHRLNADGVLSANADMTHTNLAANSSCSHISPLLIPG